MSKLAKKEKEFEVQQIRAVRYDTSTGRTHCLVKWKDFDDDQTGWEPREHCANSEKLVSASLAHHAQDNPRWTWEYYMNVAMDGKGIGWHPYDQPAQDCMSKFFQKYCKDASTMAGQIECVVSGKFQYMIDFETWQQTNVRVAPHTQRPIRCVPV